jgi:hypothetical protein
MREEIIAEILEAEGEPSTDMRLNRRIVPVMQAQIKGTKAIYIAAAEGLEKVIEAILEKWGSKPNDSQKAAINDAVRLATEKKQMGVFQKILDKFPPPKSTEEEEHHIILSHTDSNFGYNIFHWLARNGDVVFLKELLVKLTGQNIDPEEEEKKRKEVSAKAKSSIISDTKSDVKSQGLDATQAQPEAVTGTRGQGDAIQGQSQAVAKPQYCVSSGLNAESRRGRTPLSLAIGNREEEMVLLLLAYGADVWKEGSMDDSIMMAFIINALGPGPVAETILEHVFNFVTASELETWVVSGGQEHSLRKLIANFSVEKQARVRGFFEDRGVKKQVVDRLFSI